MRLDVKDFKDRNNLNEKVSALALKHGYGILRQRWIVDKLLLLCMEGTYSTHLDPKKSRPRLQLLLPTETH